MEIKRVGENKIRCALTEDEIREMGFDIDEIIGNGEATQKFMRVVLKIVEEQENISLENISPMVKAELLSDHSMAITFGGDSDLSFQQLMDAISDLVGQMTPEKMQEFRNLSKEERQGVLDAFLDQKKDTQEQRVAEEKQEKENKKPSKQQKELKKRQMICALRFFDLDEASRMGRACFEEIFSKEQPLPVRGCILSDHGLFEVLEGRNEGVCIRCSRVRCGQNFRDRTNFLYP